MRSVKSISLFLIGLACLALFERSRAQGVMGLSLTLDPDTVVQYGDSAKFTVRMTYSHPSGQPFFGWVSFKYQTPLGVFDSLTPVPSSYLIVGSGGFVNSTFYLPVTPAAFLTGGGGNPIVIWPVLAPDTSIVQGPVVVSDSVKATLYVMPLFNPESVQDKVILFPNPFSDFMFLQFASSYDLIEVSVWDMTGQVMGSFRVCAGHSVRLNTQNWPQGLYVVKISDNNGFEQWHKVLIMRH